MPNGQITIAKECQTFLFLIIPAPLSAEERREPVRVEGEFQVIQRWSVLQCGRLGDSLLK